MLAATWALDYYIPLSSPKPHPWLLVSYESLVRNGVEEIRRIFSVIGMDMPSKSLLQLQTPSATTHLDSPIMYGDDPLMGWYKRLDKDQIKRILNVTAAFGLDFYSDAPEPDYKRLIEWSPYE